MATKAERFKSSIERSGPKRAPKPARKASKVPVPGAPARRRALSESTATRNVSMRAGKKAEVELEDSATGKPSRKSTRRSKAHAKPGSNLQRRATRAAVAPKRRAESSRARARK
jgi:hypothetical protein